MNVLTREIQTGGRRLAGTRLTATIPLTQAVLNELAAASSGRAGQVGVAIHADNQLVIHYGSFHATVAVPRMIDLRTSPRITVTLASTVIAWTAKTMIKAPYVAIDGRNVSIDLSAVPQLEPLRNVWRHVHAIKISTTEGRMRLAIEVVVT